MDFIIDILVILLISYIARLFWIKSDQRTNYHSKLLFRAFSLFVIIHLILFPVLYVIIINNNTESISINENIITSERNEKLEHHIKIKENIERQIENADTSDSIFVSQILESNKVYFSKLKWDEIDDTHLILLDSVIISAFTEPIVIPEEPISRAIIFYDKNGKKLKATRTISRKALFSEVLDDVITELNQDLLKLKAEKSRNQEHIHDIQANAFWSYRQILPYTLNILFTNNFNPQSRIANVIYFAHNICVVFFLLAFIVNISQQQLLNKPKNNSAGD